MSRPAFYRLGLLAPYLLLLLLSPLWAVADALPEFLVAAVGVVVVSAFIWAIPYLRIVIGLLLWSRGQPAGRIKRVFLLAPLLLAVALVILSLFFSAADGRLLSMAAVAGLTLLIGYAFVVLWLGLEALLFRLRAS